MGALQAATKSSEKKRPQSGSTLMYASAQSFCWKVWALHKRQLGQLFILVDVKLSIGIVYDEGRLVDPPLTSDRRPFPNLVVSDLWLHSF